MGQQVHAFAYGVEGKDKALASQGRMDDPCVEAGGMGSPLVAVVAEGIWLGPEE